ncbi:TRAP transporter fused permease subunit [Acidobacteria bacterium AH-259-D05]|nr:TRAP transporter fused permease subunit [Acidobacteria bacterium AH-259-D05]
MSTPPDSPLARRLTPYLSGLIALIALAWAGELPYRFRFALYSEQVLSAILALSLTLVFLGVSVRRPRGGVPWYDWLASALGLAAGGYMAVRYPVLAREFFFRPVETTVLGVILILLVVEALRRTTGWSLLGVLLLSFTYALFGHLVPGRLSGRSLEVLKMFSFLGIDNVAMLGMPLRVISTIVLIFVFLGQLLLRSGGSAFFSDFASALMGRSRGGAAKIGVFASGLFGSISGSAVANVASTGVITIPLMRQSGYKPHVSGAIEAVASTGGQIMPPIMGAAAFLMAELLGVSYGEVVVAAILPAILYYFAVFIQADLEAGRQGIGPVAKAEIPPLGKVLIEGWYFPIPFVVLIIALFRWNLTPESAGLYAAGSMIALSLVFSYRGTRLRFGDILESLKVTGQSSVQIVIIGAVAGIIIGIVEVTGLSFGLTFVLVQLGENSLFLLLSLTAVVCIILGMGMPTTAIYFLLATLAAPPLVQLGVHPMAAHMFVLYLGLMSMITPPVALAAFTAANLAGADPMRTSVAALRFGWPGLVVPFLFVFGPSLLLYGSPLEVILAAVTAIAGIWMAAAGIAGYLVSPLTAITRASLISGGLALLVPAQVFPEAWILESGGAVLCVFLVARQIRRRSLSSLDKGTPKE